MSNIKDASQAAAIQIELMKWETAFASRAVREQIADDLLASEDLSERNPYYLANAYEYFHSTIENATSKKQIIMAWVAGEADKREDADSVYDLLMGTKISIAKARKMIRAANGTAKPAPPCATCENVRVLADTWDNAVKYDVGMGELSRSAWSGAVRELRAALNGEVTP